MNAAPASPDSPHFGQRSSRFFKLLLGASALFIAGCSAFFSVRGLGLLFIGSSVAVMIMAASLEAGKLVAASFLYRYWSQITLPLRVYLTLAVVLLIGITSMGNYGYLARAYEVTHSQIASLEQQIVPLQQDIDATRAQVDASRNQTGLLTQDNHSERDNVRAQISVADQDLATSLASLQDRRKAANDRLDRDTQALSARLAQASTFQKDALASEDAAIAQLNARIAVLDRAVDAYTAQGGANIFLLKRDGIRQGQALLAQQQPERQSIAAEITAHQARQDQLRADYETAAAAINHDLDAAQTRGSTDLDALDTEEKSLRQSHADAVTRIQQQVAALQTSDQTVGNLGADQIAALSQRIDDDNRQITRLQEQISAFDVGPYRFIARAFGASSDDIVKWLVLLLVCVFDPLAVVLTVGLNVALVHDRRASGLAANSMPSPGSASSTLNPRRPTSSATRLVAGLVLAFIAAALIFTAIRATPVLLRHWKTDADERARAALIPADSFLVLTLRPDHMQDPTGRFAWNKTAADLLGRSALAQLGALFDNGALDPDSDVYLFVKYPERQNALPTGGSPTLICGLVARLKDSDAAETGLDHFVDAFSASLAAPKSMPSPADAARPHEMVRYGEGRYLDPQGGFLSYALAGQTALVLIEVDGDPAAPAVGAEIRHILAPPSSDLSTLNPQLSTLPSRALSSDAAVSLWFDAARCFADMPKTPAAQARYQQLSPRLRFDLLMTLGVNADGRLDLLADYRYATARFDTPPPALANVLAQLGPAEPAGVPGRLMDRCAATLDIDALLARLPATLSDSGNDSARLHVEKTIVSPSEGTVEVTAHFDPKSGFPVQAALADLVR